MLKFCPTSLGLFVILFLVYCSVTTTAQEKTVIGLTDHSILNSEISRTLETLGSPPTPGSELLLSRFLLSERKVREALNSHTFKRDVVLQTIGPGGEVTGQYIRNSVFVFDDRGNRIERVLFHPRSTIREMKITREDIQDLAGAQLLGIDINEVNKYFLNWIGEEELHGLKAYVLDVRPRQKPDPHRMRERTFVGRIWIDANSFQVLNVRGIVEPQGKQRFPVFETWRETMVGPLRFPRRTIADDILYFPNHSPVHYRISVRYYDYKRFASEVKITEVD
ncbi:MAG TPA: hypothetical protein VGW76_10000 [Pyrinomonadaceae bacterium]|nr:hypothetical protein [Pyrinomonadaceae bacterium]